MLAIILYIVSKVNGESTDLERGQNWFRIWQCKIDKILEVLKLRMY